jgi:hypothetical protein
MSVDSDAFAADLAELDLAEDRPVPRDAISLLDKHFPGCGVVLYLPGGATLEWVPESLSGSEITAQVTVNPEGLPGIGNMDREPARVLKRAVNDAAMAAVLSAAQTLVEHGHREPSRARWRFVLTVE